MKKFLITFFTLSFLLILLIFPTLALRGAKNGLMLWFQTVLPTLLPFMIISNLIVKLQVTDCLTSFFYPTIGRLLGLSKAGCYPLIIGMLSGYPVGAKACADLVISRKITKDEGQFLLCFCNNASPMFIISFVSMQCLKLNGKGALILCIIYISGIVTAMIYRLLTRLQKNSVTSMTIPSYCAASLTSESPKMSPFLILDQTILNAFEILIKVGGYIILFSILAEIALHLTFIPALLRYFIIGFLEITTGTAAIGIAHFTFAQKIVLTNALTAFGGLSSHAQTYSVIMNSGLSIKKYFLFKCMNACVAGVFTLLLIHSI